MKIFFLLILACWNLAVADTIRGAGASFPAPSYFGWAHDYEERFGETVRYASIGSGGGLRQVEARIVDFGASDVPLEPAELDEKKLCQFPVLIGSIVLAYHLPGVKDGELKLSNRALERILLGEAEYWDDPAIAADNEGVALPHKKIVFVYRSDGSGTTYNFTCHLGRISSRWKEEVGTGKTVRWPRGIGGKGNRGVMELIGKTPYSIGYVEYSYKERHGLAAARIPSADGKRWVAATRETVARAAHPAWDGENHFYRVLALHPEPEGYPLVAATFILLPREYPERGRKVTRFFQYAFDDGDGEAARMGYVPLAPETREKIGNYWKRWGIAPESE